VTTPRIRSDTVFLLKGASWPAFLVDGGGTIRHANQAAIDLFGPKLETDSTMLSALWAEQAESVEQFLARCERSSPAVVPLKLLGKGAAAILFSTYISTFNWEGEKRWIFQLHEWPLTPVENKGPAPEASAAHKQKLDRALQLARSVALDFNNALTSILGHASLVLSKMEPGHPLRSSLVEIEKAAEKAAEITNQLSAFSRTDKEAPVAAPANLNAVLRRVIEVFQRSHSGLTWSMDLESRIYSAKFDEAKVQQAIVKIIENSIEAMGDRGQVVLASRNLDVAAVTHDGTVRLEPGSYVYAEIADTGRGIEPEVLPRVFEPFFTTKQGHRGLGLAWVYGIITNHGGGVAVSSQSMQGASVRIYLPATKKVVEEGATGIEDLRGTETILMVDDEDLVLNMGRTILASFGYEVLTASSGTKALETLSSSKSPIHLVITDLVMPQMSGRELIEKIQQASPGLPILCTSGYIRGPANQNPATFLQKPFTSQELLRRVKQILTASEAT